MDGFCKPHSSRSSLVSISAGRHSPPPPDYYCCYCCYQQQQHTDKRRTLKVDTIATTTHGDDGDDDDVDGRPSLFITTPNHQSAMTAEYFFGKYRQTRDSFGTLFSHRSMPSGPSFFTRRPRRRPADIKPNSLFFFPFGSFPPKTQTTLFPRPTRHTLSGLLCSDPSRPGPSVAHPRQRWRKTRQTAASTSRTYYYMSVWPCTITQVGPWLQDPAHTTWYIQAHPASHCLAALFN